MALVLKPPKCLFADRGQPHLAQRYKFSDDILLLYAKVREISRLEAAMRKFHFPLWLKLHLSK
jgi:hypothetical protein